jgi:hypothetical protein
MSPGGPGVQHEQDPFKRLPVGSRFASRVARTARQLIGSPFSLTTDADGFAVRERAPSL